jgi:protein Mpv17
MALLLHRSLPKLYSSSSGRKQQRTWQRQAVTPVHAVLWKDLKEAKRRAADNQKVKASGADGEAVPLPIEGQASSVGPSLGGAERVAGLLDAIIDTTIKAPYTWYCESLETRPLLTKACTSFVGFMLGDLVAQHISHPDMVDVTRILRLGAYGLLLDGPIGSMWYDVLEKFVCPDEPTGNKAVLMKTALDQVVYATIMTAVFFAVIRTWEGHPEAIMSTLQAKFWPTLAANYMVWPLAHVINFKFVPSQFRILYNNAVCVAWLTYLSLLTHSKMPLFFFLHK